MPAVRRPAAATDAGAGVAPACLGPPPGRRHVGARPRDRATRPDVGARVGRTKNAGAGDLTTVRAGPRGPGAGAGGRPAGRRRHAGAAAALVPAVPTPVGGARDSGPRSGAGVRTPLPAPAARTVFRHVRRLLRPHWLRLSAVAVVTVLGALASTSVPLLVRHGIDDGVLAGRPGPVQAAAVAIAGLAVLGGAVTAVRVRLSGTVTEAVLAELRRATTLRVLALTPPELRRIGGGDVLARATGDVETVGQAGRQSLPVLVRGLTLVTLAAAVLLRISLPLGAIGLVGLLVIAVAGRRLLGRTRVIYPRSRGDLVALLATMRETLAGIRIVQGFGRQDDRANVYGRLNQRAVERYAEGTRARNAFFPVV